ncbi:MAG: hypothetical protein IPJ65_36615 [Archangiaceae bacterium]|nr:hypothetical protein [Archangiaceae bacterium]
MSRALLLLLVFLSCKRSEDLRGVEEKTPDGGTFLIVDDDGQGSCQLFLDGRRVKAHQPREVSPGPHQLDCGDPKSTVTVTVHEGHTFHFTYWGR